MRNYKEGEDHSGFERSRDTHKQSLIKLIGFRETTNRNESCQSIWGYSYEIELLELLENFTVITKIN